MALNIDEKKQVIEKYATIKGDTEVRGSNSAFDSQSSKADRTS